MNSKVSKSPRQPISKITQTVISPTRIRKFLDVLGLNKEIEEKLEKLNLELQKIKKESGPKEPEKPKKPEKDSTGQVPEFQKTRYLEQKEHYKLELKKYNDFESEKYSKLEEIHELSKTLNKLYHLLTKTGTKTEIQQREQDNLLSLIREEPKKFESDTEEVYLRKLNKHKYFKRLLEHTNLNNSNSIQETLDKFKQNHPELELFSQRDELSKSRIRFNDPSAVALSTLLELALGELIEFGMNRTLETQKKTLQPDHFVDENIPGSWGMFYKNLPHFKAILERQKRKQNYLEERDKEKQKLVIRERTKAKREKKTYKRKKFEYATFQDVEVKNGFAKIVPNPNSKSEKVVNLYQWFGIDTETEVPGSELVLNLSDRPDASDFNFYVQQVCKKIISDRAETDNIDFEEIKISSNAKKFLSDLIVDFISRIAPQIRILMTIMDVKTVDDEIVKTLLKMMIMDSYLSSTGFVKLKEEHEHLFYLIDEKVKLYRDYQTTQNHKKEVSESIGHPSELAEVSEKVKTETKTETKTENEVSEVGHSGDPTEVLVSKNTTETKTGTKTEVPEHKSESNLNRHRRKKVVSGTETENANN